MQPPAPPSEAWWRRAVVYEIYPRSFQDSNGDGVGDLPGVTARLPYLQDLGIDAVWLTPFYPSPQVDFGYDVSDYEAVDPQFGTLADFDALVREAHARGIRVLVDLVLNHTSDQHAWFREARASRDAARRDWYVFRDPAPDGGPPNNWCSTFGPTAWTRDPATGQYYYHYFYPEQPDLNWRNPEVEAAIRAVLGFWIDRGVDGFRLDAANYLFEDPALRDNPVTDELRPGSATERVQQLLHNRDLPEVHDALCRLRAYTDARDPACLLVGEAYVPTLEELAKYYGRADDEVHLPFNFFFTKVAALSAPLFRAQVEAAERALAGRWTTWVLSNHDLPRAYDRFDVAPAHRDAAAKLLALMLLTLRGTPFLYYGEELGMCSTHPTRLEDVRDPVGRRYWPGNKGRDCARTPMQWDGSVGAGFSSATPWLALAPDAAARNAAAQARDPDSVLSFYKRAIALRRATPCLIDGAYATVDAEHPGVFAYDRRTATDSVRVLLNMSATPHEVLLSGAARVLLGSARAAGAGLAGPVVLDPYECLALALDPVSNTC